VALHFFNFLSFRLSLFFILFLFFSKKQFLLNSKQLGLDHESKTELEELVGSGAS